MLKQYALIEQKNKVSAELETLAQRLEVEELSVMQVILPIDDIEKRLVREGEVLSLRIELLEEYHKRPSEQSNNNTDNLEDLNQRYQQALKKQEQIFIEGYHALLKARDRIYINNQFLDIKPRQTELLESFCKAMQVEMQSYANFIYDSSRSLAEQLATLKAALTEKQEQAFALSQQKAQLSQRLQDRQVTYGKRSVSINNSFQKQRQSIEQSLPEAAAQGNLNLVKSLIEKQSIFQKKSYINQLGINGYNALHAACRNGHLSVVVFLLQQGADYRKPDEQGYLPLHFALEQSHSNLSNLVKLLVKKEGDVNLVGPYGITPLHTAAFFGNTVAVECLLNLGAYVNAQETQEGSGRTPLHSAASQGHNQVVELLLNANANVGARNKANETPLYEALRAGHLSTAQLFLEQGYWLSRKDLERLMEEGKKSGHLEVIELIKQLLNQQLLSLETCLPRTVQPGEDSTPTSFSYRGAYPGMTHFHSPGTRTPSDDAQDEELQEVMLASLEKATQDEVKFEWKWSS
ncbi:ankyrin repeat domain-containing protein [Legionella clemsonensis]|uniref:Ankyrin repeats (3 copies) n=1 Tax=Legionella clemsonensis TaxID=1867846 RepID=A0A222P4J7_9GAMM|nr:ankyrin repeat domain-containing protein [Legionella clemsonensis]ASQ46766.1 Ankyrin repeats (3 copies) [Legionella clemsonensis]